MYPSLIEKTKQHVKARLTREGSGHDWWHTYRVWQTARYLQSQEGGDLEFIEVAALLHCAAEHDLRARADEKIRSLTMAGVLHVLEIDETWHEPIIAIAEGCRFKGKDTKHATTLEGKIVQDANYLDALGAIGLARGFTAGGYLGRVIHDPDVKSVINLSKEMFQKRKREGTSINYFYEKSLRLLSLINTATAKKIATKRLEFMKNFLEEFKLEWDLEDIEIQAHK